MRSRAHPPTIRSRLTLANAGQGQCRFSTRAAPSMTVGTALARYRSRRWGRGTLWSQRRRRPPFHWNPLSTSTAGHLDGSSGSLVPDLRPSFLTHHFALRRGGASATSIPWLPLWPNARPNSPSVTLLEELSPGSQVVGLAGKAFEEEAGGLEKGTALTRFSGRVQLDPDEFEGY